MAKLAFSYTKEQLNELFAGAEPPTDDDVSVTNDGRRLDTPEAVIAFFEEMKAARLAEAGG